MVRPFLLPRNKLATEAGKWSLTDQNKGGGTLAAHKNIDMKVVGGASLPDGHEVRFIKITSFNENSHFIVWTTSCKPATCCFEDKRCVLQEWTLPFFWRRIKGWGKLIEADIKWFPQSKKSVVKKHIFLLYSKKQHWSLRLEISRKCLEKTDWQWSSIKNKPDFLWL